MITVEELDFDFEAADKVVAEIFALIPDLSESERSNVRYLREQFEGEWMLGTAASIGIGRGVKLPKSLLQFATPEVLGDGLVDAVKENIAA